jgi:multidrug transporter EmrE-like cation transporter
MIQLGILLALASAFVANVGLLCKYRGAVEAPEVELSHPLRSAAGLFRSRWWLIGFGVATIGWTFHVAALSVAPLSLVETTLSGGILLLAWIAERWFGVKVGPREWIGVGLCAIGLVLLALTSAGHGGASSRYSVEAMASFEAVAVGVGTALLVSGSAGSAGRASGPFLGIAAGLMLGVANIAVKALTGTVPGDPLSILVSPWALTALAAGVGAFLALGRGLQTGGAIPVITLSSVTANLVSVAGGIAVFGDPMGTDPLAIAARSVAFAAVIAAAIVLPAPGQAAAARA